MTSAADFPIERRSFLAQDGVVLRGEVAGDPTAPCVVLLHGGGQTRHYWSDTFAALVEAGYRVLSYDSRGHGESDWSPDGRYTFLQRAEDLRAVLSDVQPPIALVGASMGGIAAMQAIGNGLRVAALVLVDIVLRPDRAGVQRVRDFMVAHPQGFATIEEAAEAVAAYNPHRPRPADPSGLARNLRRGSDGRYYWHWDPRLVPDSIDGDLAEMERITEAFRASSGLPVLLVRGGRSDVVSERNANEFRQLVPHVEIRQVTGAGHMVAGDSSREFNDLIIDFLVRHLPPYAGQKEAKR